MAQIRVFDGAVHFGADFPCPHCGHLNSHWFAWWSHAPKVVLCDNESGGCDTYFAVTGVVQFTVTPTVRKIEGIERTPPAAWEAEA